MNNKLKYFLMIFIVGEICQNQDIHLNTMKLKFKKKYINIFLILV